MKKELQPIPIAAPGANLEAYVQAVNGISVLSAEREKELSEALFHQGDLNAARELVMSHLRFVVYVARSYSGYGLAEADLIQEGNVGLMKAVKRFDPSYGVRLVSFAVHWIKAEIHEYILRNWRIVKVATTKAQRKLFFNLRSSRNRLGWMNEEEVNSIAEDLNVAPKVVRQMEGRMAAQDASFDLPVDDKDGDSVPAPAGYLEDHQFDPARLVEEENIEAVVTEGLHSALRDLDPRSRDIIEQRWLTDKKATLHQLAAQYNISAERVRQLEQNAMKKLRGAINQPV